MIYICSPYSHPSADIRHERALAVEDFAAFWAKRGKIVYCPIASWHHIAVRIGMPKDFPFWMRLDFSILRHCSEVWVLMLDDWEDSRGVTAEIELANRLHMPIHYFSADHFGEVALQAYVTGEGV